MAKFLMEDPVLAKFVAEKLDDIFLCELVLLGGRGDDGLGRVEREAEV